MSGFPPGKFDSLPIPPGFFSQYLAEIDNLAELKVVLFCFWALPQKEDEYRYLRYADFANYEPLIAGLEAIDAKLDDALAACEQRGTLLSHQIKFDFSTETLYFVNTDQGRKAIDLLKIGRWRPTIIEDPVEILPERPNIYSLYEQNIGPLKGLVIDELKSYEKDYPYEWIEDAIGAAVKQNARNLNYIRAILERRQEEGKRQA